MYPSEKDPLFGVFIKNFISSFKLLGVEFTSLVLIKGKTKFIFNKLFNYITYYLNIIICYFKKNHDLIYIHYISHNAPILALCLFVFGKKKPIVINVHGSDIVKTDKSFFSPFIRYCLRRIDCLIVPSIYFKLLVMSLYPFLDEKKIEISPSGGINFNVFFTKNTKIKENSLFHFGLVSRIDYNKGWYDFILAIYELKNRGFNFKVSIAGDGREKKLLLEEIKKRKLDNFVTYLGLVKQKDLIDIYNNIDVLVFPTKLKEGLGLVGLESMACSTPVIASNSSGPATYVQEGKNGFLFRTGDVSDLVLKMENAIKLNSCDLIKMKNNALREAEKYESKLVVNKLYNKLLKLL